MDTPTNIIPLPGLASPAVKLTADEIRSKLIEQFEQFKPALQQYQDYAQRCAALSLEFHEARFAEAMPGIPVEELTLVCQLDARETPKSLDKALAQIHPGLVKRIAFDRTKGTYFLFA